MATKTASPSKSAFVRDFLRKNRSANRKAVEQAWHEAGYEGPIQSSLVSTLRRKLGLIGNKRGGSRTADSQGGALATGRKPLAGGRDRALAEIEEGIDRLILRLMTLGGFEAIEHELRKVRRLLYCSSET